MIKIKLIKEIKPQCGKEQFPKGFIPQYVVGMDVSNNIEMKLQFIYNLIDDD